MGGHTRTQTDLQTETYIKWAKQGPTLRNGVQPRCVMDRSLEEEANIYEVRFSNDLQLGQTPTSLRDFDKKKTHQNHHHTTGHKVLLLQNVRAPSTVPKSVVKTVLKLCGRLGPAVALVCRSAPRITCSSRGSLK